MSLEHAPPRDAGVGHNGGPDLDAEFWHTLINQREAAKFLGLSIRTMEKLRQTGDGPEYVRVSPSCLRYTRLRCNTWADARVRKSTADLGGDAE